jgi:hypothetical protein
MPEKVNKSMNVLSEGNLDGVREEKGEGEGGGRREKGEGRREKGEGRREKGEGAKGGREKGEERKGRRKEQT